MLIVQRCVQLKEYEKYFENSLRPLWILDVNLRSSLAPAFTSQITEVLSPDISVELAALRLQLSIHPF